VVLVQHLPPQSATMTGLRAAQPELAAEASQDVDPNAMAWSQTDMLLASLIDSMQYLCWMFAAVNFKGQRPAPEPIPRPGVARKKAGMLVADYERMTGEKPPLYLVKGAGTG
jgi:hypothetical protein